MKTIYLAGGCFWGTQKYLSLIPGVVSTQVGYANGKTPNPSYEDVCRRGTGHAETVKVEYDPSQISLTFLLEMYYKSIDPTSLNRQGGDVGAQYRTGIYFTDPEDRAIIEGSVVLLSESLRDPVAIEVLALENFYPAEDYHQSYLDKNPAGYCHIDFSLFEEARNAVDTRTRFRPAPKAELKDTLSSMQFEVTQNNATEPPFANQYYDTFEKGIYVDVTSGEPLFVSSQKFESGCGWPSFAKPIAADSIEYLPDDTHGRKRTEVRAKNSDAHLGHVFEDGPREMGGLRYCINSASLRFIPRDKMEAEGYGYLLSQLED